MTPQRWDQLAEALEAALALDVVGRRDYVRKVKESDAVLGAELERLVKSHERSGGFLESDRSPIRDPLEGRRAGPYRLIRQTGHGGMATVYLAERADGEYKSRVAIKMLHRHLEAASFLRRFRTERQVLAALSHSGIAKLLDGGTMDDGVPYLAMEYVDGVHLDEWRREQNPSIGARLRLMCAVCSAVQYAHDHQVIHRDIKPGNILVTADHSPKLLDFGIAKVLSPDTGVDAMATATGAALMTPQYASPEQVRGDPLTPATDVYSLGVVMYDLLTGQLPYPISGRDPAQTAREICETQPERPSAVVPDTSLRKALEGDVNNIVLKALRKEPERRYRSVAELSEDIERHLTDKPVHAGPDTFTYRSRKLLKRNRTLIGSAAAGAAVVFAAAAILWQVRLRPAGEAEDVGPVKLTDNAEALRAYEEGLKARTVFREKEAEAAFRRALQFDPRFLMARYQLADSLRFSGKLAEARRAIAGETTFAAGTRSPKRHRLLIQALQQRLDFQYDEAVRILEAAHREFPEEVEPMFQLAALYSAQAEFARAAKLLEEVIRIYPRHALAHDQLGYQYAFLGDVNRAVASIDRFAALLPPGDVVPFCSRGDAYLINEHFDQAIDQYGKIGYRTEAAIAATFAASNERAASMLASTNGRGEPWFSAAGDVAAARGKLQDAAHFYAHAMDRTFTGEDLRPWFGLLRVVRVYFEQRRPELALALDLSQRAPFGAGVRGTAYMLLGDKRKAESEFAALRNSLAPILGESVAHSLVAYHRMQAAFYSGRFSEVIESWPLLPRMFWSVYALDVGRAYLETGMLDEAEHHLRLSKAAQLGFFMNSDLGSQHSALTWMLTQYYLGSVMEKRGRQKGAMTLYLAFVRHFQDSTEQLPQVAAAERAVASMTSSEHRTTPARAEEPPPFDSRGRALFRDEFAGPELKPGWTVERGKWELADGFLKAVPGPDQRRSVELRYPLQYRDARFEFAFRSDGWGYALLRLLNEGGPVCYFIAGREHLLLNSEGPEARPLAKLDFSRQSEELHTAVLEIRGDRVIGQMDGQYAINAAGRQCYANMTGFGVKAVGAALIDYVRVYEVAQARARSSAASQNE